MRNQICRFFVTYLVGITSRAPSFVVLPRNTFRTKMRISRRRTMVPATQAMHITWKKMVVYLVKTPKATVSYPLEKLYSTWRL